MKSSKIAFPPVHKNSALPTLAVFIGILCSLPILMIMWVAICSQFTRVEGSNSTDLYNVYVTLRAVSAMVFVGCLAVYDCRRSSVYLIAPTIMGLFTSCIKLVLVFSAYLDKKELADAMSMHPNYSQNYIDMAEASLIFIMLATLLLYLFGVLKNAFPVIFVTVISVIISMYSVITCATTYEVESYVIFYKTYGATLGLCILLFSLSSKSRAQIESKARYMAGRANR